MPRAEDAIVLAGGLGTRLRGQLDGVPKALAPVAGRPFLAWLLDQLNSAGIRRVVLATGHLSSQLHEAIGDDWQGMKIEHSVESSPLGTGGAVALAAERLAGRPVHVANGDTFLRFDPAGLERAVAQAGTRLGVALAHVDDVSRYGSVEVRDGRVQAFNEKGGRGAGLINAGSYFLTAEALASLPRGRAFSFEEEVLLPAAQAGELAAYSDTSDFIDIGVPEDFALAQARFAR